jgi:hypothetical protein
LPIPDGAKVRTIPIEDLALVTGQSRFSASADMRVAAYGLRDGGIRLIDLNTQRELWTVQATKEFIIALTFSPDGNQFAVVS